MEEKDGKLLNRNKKIQTSQIRFRNDKHGISITKANTIALSSNYDKRTQTFDRRKTFAYGAPNKLLDQNEKIDKRKILTIFK